MISKPQFRAELEFHFREHGSGRRRWFMFGDDLHRRVPMQMDGVDGLHTVGIWIKQSGTFKAGDKVQVDCRVIAPDLFSPVVKPGVKFELWESGLFAKGTVLKRIESGWPSES